MESKLTPNISVSDVARQRVSTVMSRKTAAPFQSERRRASLKAVLAAALKQSRQNPGCCQTYARWSVYQCELQPGPAGLSGNLWLSQRAGQSLCVQAAASTLATRWMPCTSPPTPPHHYQQQ